MFHAAAIAISHKCDTIAVQGDDTMEDKRCFRQLHEAYIPHPHIGLFLQDDHIPAALNERSHTDSCRRKLDAFSFSQEVGEMRYQYIVGDEMHVVGVGLFQAQESQPESCHSGSLQVFANGGVSD